MTMSMSLFRYAAETPAFQVEHTCGNTLQPPSVLTLPPRQSPAQSHMSCMWQCQCKVQMSICSTPPQDKG